MTAMARWRALLPQARRLLLSYPGVTGVGLGTRGTGGTADELAWRVYVAASAGAEPGGARVPAMLLGLPTQVLAARPGVPAAGATLYTAGISIETNHHDGEGTLGGFAQDKNGHPVLLSCSHVLFPGFEVIDNLKVYSPDYSSCCSGGDPIGTPVFDQNQPARSDDAGGWVGGYANGTWTGGFTWITAKVSIMGTPVTGDASETDCAIARLDPGIRFQNVWQVKQGSQLTSIPIAGAVSDGLGIGKGPPLGTAPTVQQYVRVYSAVTGQLKYGTMLSTPPADIVHVDDPDKIIYRWGISDPKDSRDGIKTSVNQFLILPRPTPVPGQSLQASYSTDETLSFESGDSGSLVINSDNLVIGMIIRKQPIEAITKIDRSDMEFANVGALGVATPIQAILNLLGITIPAASGGWSGTVPSAGPAMAVSASGPHLSPALAAQQQGVARLRAGMLTSLLGRLLLGKIAQHRREVRRLLSSVRPIAAAWRELNGAGFYHHCLRGVRTPGHQIPASINGVTRQQLADAIMPLFARYASPALRRDIERHGSRLASALLTVETMDDVPAALARHRTRP
jgi:hypothetical protein